jgi:adenylate kinase family enzyme
MIIGVVGFIGSGKGTVADILVEKHGFVKLSFADAVKDATAAIFGWPRALLEGDTLESREFRETKDEWWSKKFEFDFSPRLALQLMGTEAGRNVFHQDVWVHALERKAEMYKNVVIADVRFPNEIDWMRSKGGFAVRVQRGPDPIWYDTAVIANRKAETHEQISRKLAAEDAMVDQYKIHYSEWAWAGSIMDYHLDNNGNISMLEADISHLLKVFTGPQKSAILAA